MRRILGVLAVTLFLGGALAVILPADEAEAGKCGLACIIRW
jgi:hypothetical protein